MFITIKETVEIIVKGMFNGIGSAIGTYFAVRYAIKHGELLFNKLLKKKKKR